MAGVLACGAALPTDDGSEVTIRIEMHLAGETADRPATAARILAYAGRDTLRRSLIAVKGGSLCSLEHTPDFSCEYTIPKGRSVTLIAAEGSGDVDGDLRSPGAADTAHSASFVQFVGYTSNCVSTGESGACAFVANDDITTVRAEFRYMTQVTVYQVGAAALDFYISAATPPLRLPGDGVINIDGVGCWFITQSPPGHCDNVHAIGADPVHRFTVRLPRNSVMLVLPGDGAQSFFRRWDGPCIPSAGGIDCLVSASSGDTAGTPIVLTLKYEYWQCPSGVSDHDDPPGTCTLVQPD
jgi:hypothetical protein